MDKDIKDLDLKELLIQAIKHAVPDFVTETTNFDKMSLRDVNGYIEDRGILTKLYDDPIFGEVVQGRMVASLLEELESESTPEEQIRHNYGTFFGASELHAKIEKLFYNTFGGSFMGLKPEPSSFLCYTHYTSDGKQDQCVWTEYGDEEEICNLLLDSLLCGRNLLLEKWSHDDPYPDPDSDY